MSPCREVILRPLTEQEWQALEHIVRLGIERADVVAQTKEVLAVSFGCTYRKAAAAGRDPWQGESNFGPAALLYVLYQVFHVEK